MPALTSGPRQASLRRTPDGVVLEFGQVDGPVYLERPLGDLLTCSAGRPWQPSPLTCPDGWWISRRPGEHRAGCRTGPLAVEVRLAFDDGDRLNLELCWRNTSKRRVADLAVGLLLDLGRVKDSQLTIPGVIYNDNPSADPARAVPRIGPTPGGGFVAEEDRLPIPGANLEWREGRERRWLSVISRPQARRSGDGQVRYGSLGAIRQDGPVIAALSGVLMFDGKQDVRYVSKAETEATDDGYLTLRPGEVYTQHLVLDWGRQELRGHAFRHLVESARTLFTAAGSPGLALVELITLKTVALDNRWYQSGTVAGYTKFSDIPGNGPRKSRHFMYGWTGQALKLAWCDAQVGFNTRDRLRIDRCRAAVEFYLAGSPTPTPGLRHNAYQVSTRRWTSFRAGNRPMVSSRAYGETISDLTDIITLFRDHDEPVPPSWLNALEEAMTFLRGTAQLADGTFPVGWRLDGLPAATTVSSAGIPCVLAALKASSVLDSHELLSEATVWLSRYHDQHARTFDRPFSRSTLDAACEDKEAGMYYFMAAYELLRRTGDPLYATWCEVSADWLLTWVYVWSPEQDEDSPLHAAGFNAIGWPTVSVQNHHLDAFLPTYELLSFGLTTDRPAYVAAARTTLHALSQTVAAAPNDWNFPLPGEQGEAVFQTHWQRRGHTNTWNPSWVIAVPLANALRIQALR
ncbi:hypothetical protein EV137_7873 [Kribbella pratensis]|uniref:Metal-independent alpha-mannosidase n=1 Tax=Kribbella pratensis TaxID=2512112 RepID=A0ABY2F637_9ACTN|nr:hypothetical protein [Kribbella pratensis]TDW81863.1 hypothetical protein EV137_7873 [Kribbella pratensis]